MQLPNLYHCITLALALAASPAFGAISAQQSVSDLESVRNSIIETRKTLEGYNGGLTGAMRVASSIYNTHKVSEDVRKRMGDSDPFSGSDGDAVMEAYRSLQPELIKALKTGEQKAPAFKSTGVSYVARSMVNSLKIEKDDFENSMKSKLSEEHLRQVSPSIDEVDKAFASMAAALRD